MKELLKDLLSWDKMQREGVVYLLGLIILVLVFRLLIPFLITNQSIDYTAFNQEIEQFKQSLIPKEDETQANRLDKYITEKYESLVLFNFDPNKTSPEEWVMLGLTDKQIKTIETYKSRGGKFVDKEDFRKIYGIRQKQYEFLKPYIQLPDKQIHINNFDSKYKQYENPNKNNTPNQPDSLFPFDPNTIEPENLISLGLSEKQVNTITNYRSKGGRFKTKEDFAKMYGIKPEQYKELEPFIIITENKKEEDIPINIELNQASIEEIKQLKGIGEYYAARIIKYRDLLGGFTNKEQILEVYGFKQEVYEKIQINITVNPNTIKKIRINFANYDELKQHPYIGKKTATSILDYRDHHGPIKQKYELKKFFEDNKYNKAEPYLTVE